MNISTIFEKSEMDLCYYYEFFVQKINIKLDFHCVNLPLAKSHINRAC